MKQNDYKIALLVLAIGLIIGAITLMINTASVSAPSEPNLSPVISLHADSLTEVYNDGAFAADFRRALDFNELCLRERQIESRVYDRNIRALVSDSASRAYAKFRRIYNNASSWSYSNLQSALNQMQTLKQYKLANGTTAAMDNHGDSCYMALCEIDSEYKEGLRLCKKSFGGTVNYESARQIINEANNFLALHPKLNNNVEIAQKHRNMKSSLTLSHVIYIKSKIHDMGETDFSTVEELESCGRTISASIQNFKEGIRNRVYVSNVESAENLQANLSSNIEEAKSALEARSAAAE